MTPKGQKTTFSYISHFLTIIIVKFKVSDNMGISLFWPQKTRNLPIDTFMLFYILSHSKNLNCKILGRLSIVTLESLFFIHHNATIQMATPIWLFSLAWPSFKPFYILYEPMIVGYLLRTSLHHILLILLNLVNNTSDQYPCHLLVWKNNNVEGNKRHLSIPIS